MALAGACMSDVGRRLYGVNLGGWLVLERWMSPTLFESLSPTAEDESSLLAEGGADARRAVERFRESFIVEEDFRWLREVAGINAVRLPVGFWCLEDHAATSPFLPTSHFVDLALGWAQKHGLGVILELHAAVGSQNGKHHSGRCGSVGWLTEKNRSQNLKVLHAWAARWGCHPALLGFGLGNEVEEPKARTCNGAQPLPWMASWFSGCDAGNDHLHYWSDVQLFYTEAAQLVRPLLRPDVMLVIDTCWDSERFPDSFLQLLPGPVMLDYHHYECFGETRTVEEHTRAAKLERELLGDTKRPGAPIVIGEFSLALKEDTPGCEAGDWQRRFFEKQTNLAEQHGAGWFFWSYKLAREDWPHWSFRKSFECGWIPHFNSNFKACVGEAAVEVSSWAPTAIPESTSLAEVACDDSDEDPSEADSVAERESASEEEGEEVAEEDGSAREATHGLPFEFMEEVVQYVLFQDLTPLNDQPCAVETHLVQGGRRVLCSVLNCLL